ncbi:hypothetical protein [Pseudanabaena sp. FACHB-2040]|uniref:hypothetical protein n=1 Tax=Pseudanabaena sp. FACHB-2040 TaxID=2692859 RepID=UPI001681DAAF|nr:hypothetical protein [Pseudanabaena sp. FACHB-2040]MBD2256410.1 hypothetical protein [Pseudanabaena sp. FACHB-2040]
MPIVMPRRKSYSFPLTVENRLLQAIVLIGSVLLLLVILQILLPWLVLAALFGAVFWLWQRQQQRQQDLHQLFYQLIRSSGGRISVLDFAIAARLTGPQARTFLDARAREFYANFEPTEQGDILYTFSSPGIQTGSEGALAIAVDPSSVPEPPILPDQLAARLKCSTALLHQKKWATDFGSWSGERDPEGQSWRYDPLADQFFPLA